MQGRRRERRRFAGRRRLELLQVMAQLLEHHLQVEDLLVLLDEHRQEHDFKGQQMGGVGRRRQVMAGGGQQFIERPLVGLAQGATETGERLLLLQEGVGDGGECAAHRTWFRGD